MISSFLDTGTDICLRSLDEFHCILPDGDEAGLKYYKSKPYVFHHRNDTTYIYIYFLSFL